MTAGNTPTAGAAGAERPQALRSELRAAASHIVAFSELVLEEFDQPDEEVMKTLEQIRVAGRELIDLPVDDAPALAAAVSERVDRVLAGAAAVRQQLALLGQDGLLTDIAPIEAAARQVGELVAIPDRPARQGSEPAEGSGDPAYVLVVDDDPLMRKVLTRRLERLGHTVREAEDGRQALDILRAEPVDLVLTDLRMPEMGGLELLENLKADPALRDVPAIMVSGADDSTETIRAIELGAEDFLPKPFDPTVLRARVGATLEKKWLRDRQRALNAELEERVASQVEEINRLSRLQRFLPPQVAELVVSRGDGGDRLLESHRRQVAVLFCDLRGFTAFSETAEPEDVMGVLREFHGALGVLVHQFEATVGDFTGDGMMVFFGDPIPIPDPALRAVQLAVAMREASRELLRAWRRRGHELGFSAGVSFGYATLGQIGFEGRYDYGVVGTVVNLAARLCSHAGDGQILLSHRTAVATEDHIVVKDVGPVAFKGMRDPVPVYSLVDMRSGTGGPPGGETGRS